MKERRAILWLLPVFFGFLSSPVNAQINLKTGYQFSISPMAPMYEAASAFAKPDHTKAFRKANWLHGFDAGIRFKGDIHAFEISWQGARQVFTAQGTVPPDQTSFQDKIIFSANALCLGYQISSNGFGIGAEIQYQWYRSKASLENPDRTFSHTQTMPGYSFYTLLILQGQGSIDFALKPFITFPGKTTDLSPLITFSESNAQVKRNKWTRFGISLIFYNGGK